MINTHWFPMPNDLSADSCVELMADPEGTAHLGVWTGLLMVASRAKPRGSLVREDGRPHDSESLARVMRQPERVVSDAIDRLIQIGLLEHLTGNPPKRVACHGTQVRRHGRRLPRNGRKVPQNRREQNIIIRKGMEEKRTEPNAPTTSANPSIPALVAALILS